ncbi:unnamed protein product [Schistocephalus solidus]|uniref:Speckle-type POZ protein-like B n=1 Tax=Schistocephalus solidus TaxID=70667 RepID=A0A0V0J3T7_SCHSO|nr:unnamed protein product [Schistocephalus solidus]
MDTPRLILDSTDGQNAQVATVSRTSTPPPLDAFNPPVVAEYWCHTQVRVTKLRYIWTISNFSFCREELGEVVKSSVFSSGQNDKLKWCLRINPKGLDEESREYLSLYLLLVNCGTKSEARAKFKFSILNAKREETKAMESQRAYRFVQGKDWGFKKFIRRDVLMDEASGLLPNDRLTLVCEISVVGETLSDSGQVNNQPITVPECRLNEDIGTLLFKQLLTDVTLVVVSSQPSGTSSSENTCPVCSSCAGRLLSSSDPARSVSQQKGSSVPEDDADTDCEEAARRDSRPGDEETEENEDAEEEEDVGSINMLERYTDDASTPFALAVGAGDYNEISGRDDGGGGTGSGHAADVSTPGGELSDLQGTFEESSGNADVLYDDDGVSSLRAVAPSTCRLNSSQAAPNEALSTADAVPPTPYRKLAAEDSSLSSSSSASSHNVAAASSLPSNPVSAFRQLAPTRPNQHHQQQQQAFSLADHRHQQTSVTGVGQQQSKSTGVSASSSSPSNRIVSPLTKRPCTCSNCSHTTPATLEVLASSEAQQPPLTPPCACSVSTTAASTPVQPGCWATANAPSASPVVGGGGSAGHQSASAVVGSSTGGSAASAASSSSTTTTRNLSRPLKPEETARSGPCRSTRPRVVTARSSHVPRPASAAAKQSGAYIASSAAIASSSACASPQPAGATCLCGRSTTTITPSSAKSTTNGGVTLRQFSAHKAILAARSPVFAAMFEHSMEESRVNRVQITDIEPDTLAEVLRFVYTGQVAGLDRMAQELLAAADKYQLERLKAMCEEALVESLTVETACDILSLADVHSAEQLKAHTLDFIMLHAQEVCDSDGYDRLVRQRPHLLNECFRTLACQQLPLRCWSRKRPRPS